MPRSKLSFLVVFLLFISAMPFHAQDSGTIITIAMAERHQLALSSILEDFDNANADIQLEIVNAISPVYATNDSLDAYLDQMETLVSSADIVLGSGQFDILATRAAYYLNLDALINADASFNADDFYPAMLKSYQWDLGTWALPISADMFVVHYIPAAFDEVGLDYPDEVWTVEDLRLAAEAFVDSGAVEPIRSVVSPPYLSLLSLDTAPYDPTQAELSPMFMQDALLSTFETWSQLDSAGYIISGRIPDKPIIIGTSSMASFLTNRGYQMMNLPNNINTVIPIAAGISSGTANPEAAYRVLRFLSEDYGVYQALEQPIPALKALATEQTVTPNGALPDDAHQALLSYIEAAQPYSNLLFNPYLMSAYFSAINGSDLEVVLSDAETQAIDDLQAAATRRDRQIVVNTPNQTPADAATIRFGLISSGFSHLEVYAEEFAATHPIVGQVQFVTLAEYAAAQAPLDTFASSVDCFYKPTLLNKADDLSILLALDPLLAVDTELDSSDFAGSTLALVSQDGLIYGFPLHIQPQVIIYNMDLLEAQGIALPALDWTTSEFEDVLRAVHSDANLPAALDIRTYGGTAILNLIAAYGALPIDHRTSPETIDFSSEASLSAIRHVLDLARDGYIQYDPLFDNPDESLYQDMDDAALYAQFFTNFHNNMIDNVDTSEGNYGMATFPRGSSFSPIDYDLGAGYISASSQYFTECYDFLKYLSQQADAFEGVPARISIVESDNLRQQEGEENIAFYRAVHDLLQEDNLIEFQFAGSIDIVDASKLWIRTWLFRAMDHYVFEDADLEEELRLAEETTLLYQDCIATLPAYDPKTQSFRDFLIPYVECVVAVDPDMMEAYGYLLQ